MGPAVGELSQIPFTHIIGGVLKSAIEAQAMAAMSTVDFIQKVGFVPPTTPANNAKSTALDTGKVRNVTFSYTKKNEEGDSNDVTLSVPILTIVPIPYIRIEHVTIAFKAKLSDTLTSAHTDKLDVSASLDINYRAVEFRSSVSYQQTNTTSSNQSREYSLDVNVRAVQDAMPAGLSRVLDLLEASITAPAGAQTAKSGGA